jgi:protocatechuate 3,4-dioxygenase beta subunit
MAVEVSSGSAGPDLRSAILRNTRIALVRCLATADNIRGPFYREGAPFRVDLAEPDEPGDRLTIAGRVMGLPDCEPLGAAVLDVWQANARGLYSNMLGLARRGDHGRFRLRGKIPAAGDGHYRFETIIPGHYPLWFLTRPRHIHFIVSHPRYAPLTTQLFFAGDRYLASDPPGER